MNLRCTYCQTPFAIGRLEKLAAIQKMQAENLTHYDVFCPRCRRANSVSRQRLEIFTPGWQEGLKTLEAEAAQIEQVRQEPAPAETVDVKPAAEETRRRHSPRPKAAAPTKPTAKKAPSKAAPAAKSKADATSSTKGKKPAAKPAPKAKSAAKPAAQKSTTKKSVKKK